MPLTTEQNSLRKRIYNQIKVDEPIESTDSRYVPIYEHLDTDPIDELKTEIDLLEVESTQFFSGFRGSGKSTELFRLKKNLEANGCFVLYANALEYINPAVPLNITELLISIAGAFSDALKLELGKDQSGNEIVKETFWTRIWHFLDKTDVKLTEFGLSAEGNAGIAKAGGNIKFALKDTESFRQRVQAVMKNRVNELKSEVDKFILDGVKLIHKEKGETVKIVFIFDQLEQIRGSLNDEEAIIKSVQEIFTQNAHLLKLQYLNTIYTVPPWLRFVATGQISVTLLRGIKQWENDQGRTKYEKGNQLFREIIEKRFLAHGMNTFFGEGQQAKNKLDKFVDNCGGSLRHLLRLVNIAMLRVKEVPFSDSLIDGAISELENSFVVAIDDARWLDKIAKSRSDCLESTESDNVSKLTRLIDTHLVLYFKNGSDWYDIHPLVRKKVANIIQQNPTEE